LDNGLDPSEYTNKSGRATLVTRMSEHGVPREVGMRLTGHFNARSYTKYDWTLEAQTRAAQRCVKDSISYPRALELEIKLFRQQTIEGVKPEVAEHPSLPAPVAVGCSLGLKRDQEVQEVSWKHSRICVSDEGTHLPSGCCCFLKFSLWKLTFLVWQSQIWLEVWLFKFKKMKIADDAAPVAGGCSRVQNIRGLGVRENFEFAKLFDWESNIKLWEDERRKCDTASPITALFGQLVNCSGVTINLNGAVNFKGWKLIVPCYRMGTGSFN
jgi:hypothetical protein